VSRAVEKKGPDLSAGKKKKKKKPAWGRAGTNAGGTGVFCAAGQFLALLIFGAWPQPNRKRAHMIEGRRARAKSNHLEPGRWRPTLPRGRGPPARRPAGDFPALLSLRLAQPGRGGAAGVFSGTSGRPSAEACHSQWRPPAPGHRARVGGAGAGIGFPRGLVGPHQGSIRKGRARGDHGGAQGMGPFWAAQGFSGRVGRGPLGTIARPGRRNSSGTHPHDRLNQGPFASPGGRGAGRPGRGWGGGPFGGGPSDSRAGGPAQGIHCGLGFVLGTRAVREGGGRRTPAPIGDRVGKTREGSRHQGCLSRGSANGRGSRSAPGFRPKFLALLPRAPMGFDLLLAARVA